MSAKETGLTPPFPKERNNMEEGTGLRIKLFGDPVLRKKALAVKKITPRHKQILSSMARLMYEGGGIGLAAPQAGILETMITVDIGSGLYKLINPKVVKREGRQALEEGCLSVPGVCVKVRRAKKITVHAQDEEGKPLSIEAEDLLACVLEHEIDHLRGRLIVDYASFIERMRIKKKLEKLSRQAIEESGGIPPEYQIGSAGKKRPQDEILPESETKSCKLQL